MFAVIKTGGKQYKVQEGDVLSVEKLGLEKGEKVGFDRILLIDDGEATFVGTPVLENARVQAEVLEIYKDKKVLIFKKKRRKQYRRTRGHRQELTLVKIEKIVPDWSSLSEEEKVKLESRVVTTEEPEAKEKIIARKGPKAKKEIKAIPAEAAKGKPVSKKKSVAKPEAKPRRRATKTKE